MAHKTVPFLLSLAMSVASVSAPSAAETDGWAFKVEP